MSEALKRAVDFLESAADLIKGEGICLEEDGEDEEAREVIIDARKSLTDLDRLVEAAKNVVGDEKPWAPSVIELTEALAPFRKE